MFVFVFNPSANRETLRDFNERVREFCADNPVVGLEANAVGNNLIIQGMTAEDTDAANVPTFTATVRTLDPDAADLEEQLDGLIAQEQAKNPEDGEGDPNVPVKLIPAVGTKRAWVVILCINGVAEDNPEAGDPPASADDSVAAQGFKP